jgi:hypothetical protein
VVTFTVYNQVDRRWSHVVVLTVYNQVDQRWSHLLAGWSSRWKHKQSVYVRDISWVRSDGDDAITV